MSYDNQDKTEHDMFHKIPNPNCEFCMGTREQQIVSSWYMNNWISHKEFKRLMGLPF